MSKSHFTNLHEISAQLSELGKQARPAMRRALKRGQIAMRTESIAQLKKSLKIKNKDLKEAFKLSAPQGDRIAMYADIGYSSASLPLLYFVVGNRRPLEQWGIPVKKRRKLRVEIRPGKKTLMKGAFIQIVRGRLGVFRRRSGKGNKQLVSQRTHSIVYDIFKGQVPEKIAARGLSMFEKHVIHEIEFRSKKI